MAVLKQASGLGRPAQVIQVKGHEHRPHQKWVGGLGLEFVVYRCGGSILQSSCLISGMSLASYGESRAGFWRMRPSFGPECGRYSPASVQGSSCRAIRQKVDSGWRMLLAFANKRLHSIRLIRSLPCRLNVFRPAWPAGHEIASPQMRSCQCRSRT